MATIDKQLDQQVGRGLSKESGVSTVRELFEATVDDLTEFRTQFIAALTKLDNDAGVTDTDYASTLSPAALTLVKGN